MVPRPQKEYALYDVGPDLLSVSMDSSVDGEYELALGKGKRTHPDSEVTVLALHGRPLNAQVTYEYDEWDWNELPEVAKEQAGVLGYTQNKWDHDDEEGANALPYESLKWHEMTKEQQKAMIFFEWEPDDAVVDWGIVDEDDPEYYMQRERRSKGHFVPGRGLVGENQLFWNAMENLEGRDVLLQSKENYEAIMRHEEFLTIFEKRWEANGVSTSSSPAYHQHATFGEQLLVEGLDSSDICVGDVFEIVGEVNGLKLQVSSPRYPCYNVDKKHKSPFGAKGIRRFSMINGLAGWFCRVLREGTLQDGDRLVRTEHPHPEWDLKFLSKVMYGEGKLTSALKAKVDWKRDVSLLEELVSLQELADYEWKTPAKEALETIKKEAQEEEEEKLDHTVNIEDACGLGLLADILSPATLACACLAAPVAFGLCSGTLYDAYWVDA